MDKNRGQIHIKASISLLVFWFELFVFLSIRQRLKNRGQKK